MFLAHKICKAKVIGGPGLWALDAGFLSRITVCWAGKETQLVNGDLIIMKDEDFFFLLKFRIVVAAVVVGVTKFLFIKNVRILWTFFLLFHFHIDN